MNITLKYTVDLLSEWHVGSGLDAGTNVDALVAKTEDGLPFIPGKTVKGLLRDAMQDMEDVNQCSLSTIEDIFGAVSESGETSPGKAYFSDAVLPEQESKEIIRHRLDPFLYRAVASTKITEQGIAEPGTLRSTEVCVPLLLQGRITVGDRAFIAPLKKATKLVRHLGVQRNRGLGRCRFFITEKSNV